MEETSLSLLERVQADGDDASWQRLHAIYAPLLRCWLERYQVQDADADDLIQEVLSVVHGKLPEFQHNERVGAFRNWLRKILVYRLKNYWRARKYVPQPTGSSGFLADLENLEDDRSSISRVWNEEHDRHVIAVLMAQVRPSFAAQTWEAFQKQVIEGLPAKVVATELDMPINSVYVARSRVLSTLRKESSQLVDSF